MKQILNTLKPQNELLWKVLNCIKNIKNLICKNLKRKESRRKNNTELLLPVIFFIICRIHPFDFYFWTRPIIASWFLSLSLSCYPYLNFFFKLKKNNDFFYKIFNMKSGMQKKYKWFNKKKNPQERVYAHFQEKTNSWVFSKSFSKIINFLISTMSEIAG